MPDPGDEWVDATPGVKGVGFRIQAIWAFVAVHDDSDEGLVSVLASNGTWVPMIAADPTRLAALMPRARDLAKASNKPIRLVRFEVRTDLETFHPDGRREPGR